MEEASDPVTVEDTDISKDVEDTSNPPLSEDTGPTKYVEETLSGKATPTETVDSKSDNIVNWSDVELDEIEESNDATCVSEEATELETKESAENNTKTTERGINEILRVLSENVKTDFLPAKTIFQKHNILSSRVFRNERFRGYIWKHLEPRWHWSGFIRKCCDFSPSPGSFYTRNVVIFYFMLDLLVLEIINNKASNDEVILAIFWDVAGSWMY